MKIAKAGAVDAILAVLPNIPKSTPILATLCLTLKSLAVNVRSLPNTSSKHQSELGSGCLERMKSPGFAN